MMEAFDVARKLAAETCQDVTEAFGGSMWSYGWEKATSTPGTFVRYLVSEVCSWYLLPTLRLFHHRQHHGLYHPRKAERVADAHQGRAVESSLHNQSG